MRNKDDLIAGFEETMNLILDSKAFAKYSEMKLGLNLKEYGMLINIDIDELLSIINNSNHNSIADIGCGTGELIEHISKQTKAQCTGFDLSYKVIEKLNRKKSNNLAYSVGDIETGIEGLFDIVICVDVLYFVESIENALNHLINITRNNGICIIYYSDHHLLKNKEPIIERHLKSLQISYNVSDITKHEEISWKDSLNALEKLDSEFMNEGLGEFAKMMKNEAIVCLENNNKFSSKRFRYIIQK